MGFSLTAYDSGVDYKAFVVVESFEHDHNFSLLAFILRNWSSFYLKKTSSPVACGKNKLLVLFFSGFPFHVY